VAHKKFTEWLDAKHEGFMDHLPNLGQKAIPINQTQQHVPPSMQQQAPVKKVSLKDLSHEVDNADWHHLYDMFAQQYAKFPDDPQVKKLGMALYQSAQTKDMSSLQPFVAKHIHAQRF
jgi:hypothetical protein